MLIGGLWHGAGWNFLIWGSLHGIILGITHLFFIFDFKIKFPIYLKIFLTFNLVSFLWIFFRSENLSDSFLIINKLIHGLNTSALNGIEVNILTLFLIITPILLHKFDHHIIIEKYINKITPFAVIPIMIIFCIIGLFLSYTNSPAFIYFDF